MKNNRVTRHKSPFDFAQGKQVTSKLKRGACLFVIATLCLLFIPQLAQAATTNQISQFGITWIFDKAYEYGQFVNGDYWVVGPIKVITINPASVTVDSGGAWTKNGSMKNPVPTIYQGYDSRTSSLAAGFYVASLNVALSLPLTLVAGDTLVSTISVATPDNWPQLKTAAVLTVLGSAPAAGSFRPSICGSGKTVQYNESDLDYSFLAQLPIVSGAPSLSTAEGWFEKPWIETQYGWWAGRTFPADNMPSYGRDMSHLTSQAALMLNLNYTNAQKKTLFIRYVQLGIDLYGIVRSGVKDVWKADGGTQVGRKLPILVASRALNDSAMQAIFAKTGDYLNSGVTVDGYPNPYGPGNPQPDYLYFQEDDQTYYVTKFHVDISNNNAGGNWPLWNPDNPPPPTATPYTMDQVGLPEWSIRQEEKPWISINGKEWNTAAYRDVGGCTNMGIALATEIMGLKNLWNHKVFFDYADRYAYMIRVGGGWESWRISTNGPGNFVLNMWDAYRANYGPIWPATATVLYGDVDGNGEVSAYDAALTAQAAVGLITLTAEQTQAADVSGEGEVSAYDAALIAQKAVGLISKFPIEG